MPSALDWSPVVLRPLNPERDAPALHAILSDPDSCHFLSTPAVTTLQETVDLLKRWTPEGDPFSWVVPDAMGQATARISLYMRQPQLWEAACMTAPSARGRGIARRALAQGIEQLFGATDARKVTADIDPDNVASARVFEQLGFRLEGRLRATWSTHIGIRDSLMFGLLRDDPRPWRA